MLCVEATIGSGKHTPFSVMEIGADRVRPKAKTYHARSVRGVPACELSLSGYFGCAFFLGATKLLAWAVLKLWLFEP
jgi:hypothetical protein